MNEEFMTALLAEHRKKTTIDPLPCPFCGGKELYFLHAPGTLRFSIDCDTCDAIGPTGEENGKDSAIKAWHTRAEKEI